MPIFDECPLLAVRIARSIHVATVVQGSDGRMIWFNDAACATLRMSADELAGRTSRNPEWAAVSSDGSPLPGDEHPAMRALRDGAPVRGAVMGVQAGDDTTRWLLVDSTPTELDGERITVTLFEDITEKRAAQAEIGRLIDGLRASLAPAQFPRRHDLHVRSIYRPMAHAEGVGGDFLGLERLAEDRYVFYVGDVCGHGLEAAGLGIACRHTIFTAALLLDDPAQVLDVLHLTVQRSNPSTYVTAVVGLIEFHDGQAHLRLAVGGHPLPVLCREGRAEPVGLPGLIVGLVPGARRVTVDVRLEPGDVLVAYTDGLTDSPSPRLRDEQVYEHLVGAVSLDDAAALVHQLLPPDRSQAIDDTAALLLQFGPSA